MKIFQHRSLILASGSPRRKAYLERYGIQFQIVTSDIDETPHRNELPTEYAKRMALSKAETVSKQVKSGEVLLAADTIVTLDDKIIGKPESEDDALLMLQSLNGKTHQVISSYVIKDLKSDSILQKEVITDVSFNTVSDSLLTSYARSTEPRDKAGAYSIQGIGTFLVETINGSYNNVVGLPIEMVLIDLIEFGVLSI